MLKLYTHFYVNRWVSLLSIILLFYIPTSTDIFSQIINQAPVVNAGPDLNITLPNAATLNGTVTDDGLPNPPATTTRTWTQTSGPVGVTFSNPNSAVTTAVFPAIGTYQLTLTANDGQLSASDVVIVRTVAGSGPNQGPILSAGPDKTITLPINSVQLDGSATDDGLPTPPGGLNITWVQLTGPLGVTFSNTKTPVTTATFPQAGTYLLRLRASDGTLVKIDTAKVTVNPSSPVNQSPVVNAGIDQTITLPTNSVT
ncbi:MAG: hypothetical protein NTX22_18475, partial [Ignavibacteriales bacterium]|nr:hypothetical protein [Ignavibacteriales bacterium]